MFALVDCNSFYASCEKVFRPDLTQKPVVVLSNNDGCIIARSQEAKSLGVKMGEPYFKRKNFFTKNNISVFSANFTLYGDLSNRVMQVLSDFSPDIEIYSIDEAFLDLSGFENLADYAKQIKISVEKRTHIPISIGLGPTKTLAKLANYLAKKSKVYHGSYFLEDIQQAVKNHGSILVNEVWGIGNRYAKKLNRRGVYTVEDFMKLPEKWVYKEMTVVGLRTYRELHGKPCIPLEGNVPDKKAIMTSRSFGKPLEKLSDIEDALCTFGANAMAKLRKQNSCTSMISVFLETNIFKVYTPQYRNSITIKLPMPTDSTLIVNKYASYALKKIYKEGFFYKKTGILLTDLTPKSKQQLELFAAFDTAKHSRIMEACDRLNGKYHKSLVKTALEGTKKEFSMRQESKSKAFTTQWADIPVVKAV